MELTYGRYLKVEELLQLQQPLSEGPEHDEMLSLSSTRFMNFGSNKSSMSSKN